MSVQATIEQAIATYIGLAISGATVVRGPITTPRAEGNDRLVSVRMTGGTAARLDFAQTAWTELYALTFFWTRSAFTRDQAIDEWEAFRNVIATSPGLTLGNPGLTFERAYVSSEQWGEAFEGHFLTMSATVTVERVE